jgi:hypothetical protein
MTKDPDDCQGLFFSGALSECTQCSIRFGSRVKLHEQTEHG